MDAGRAATDAALARVFREEAGLLAATLVRLLGDFDQAEDLVQDALLAALDHWPREGIPDRPGAWLLTVARHRAFDRMRSQARYAEKLELLRRAAVSEAPEAAPAQDDRLTLIFTCCHPALAREAQVALTLRAVCGLPTAAIARAFLTSETTMAQRIVRAKRKIVAAGIPFRVPAGSEVAARLGEVLAVIYLLFNEGYLASQGAPDRPDLAEEAAWLTGLLRRLLPGEPEVSGLLALIRLHQARSAARFDPAGRLVLLRDQDRSLWDHVAIAAAGELILEAARARRPGPYQIQAAIAACHAEAPTWDETGWLQIFLLYHALYQQQPSPVVRLNRAIALRYVVSPAAALKELELIGAALDHYYLYHAARADLLRALGRAGEARAADSRALQLTANPAERALLTERLF